VPEFELFGNIGLTKTEILDGGQAEDIDGNDLSRAPALTLGYRINGVHRLRRQHLRRDRASDEARLR
jgi:hypothetical protein